MVSSPYIRDVGAQDFQARVLEASRERLVLVDFWAAWCGPCRMLAPILERVIDDYEGRVLLAKVDTDREPELAARFRVQGIPNVRAFRDGREVDGFVGVVPESEIRRLIERHAPDPDRATVEEARALAAQGHPSEAIARLEPLVARRPRSALALELADLYLGQGRSEEARRLLDALRPGDVDEAALARLRARLFFASVLEHPEGAPRGLTEAARAVFAGLPDQALDRLLGTLAESRAEERAALREAFVAALEILDSEERRLEYRRRLARLLH